MSELSELLDRYFALGVAEGKEGRDHDTPAGDAQEARQAIEQAFTRLRSDVDDLQKAIDKSEIDSGLTSNGNLWRFWSAKAKALAAKYVLLEAENTRLRDELASARAANSKLHRRAQQAERSEQIVHSCMEGWLSILTDGANRKRDRILVRWIVRDVNKRLATLRARAQEGR